MLDKRIKTLEFTKCGEVFGLIINNIFEIWSDGVIYDTRPNKSGADIPAYIYKLKNQLLGENKDNEKR